MSDNRKRDVIDLEKISSRLWSKKKTFFIVWPIVAILSVLWILPEPRFYKCSVSLAPESGGENAMGGLANIASSFGVNVGVGGSDAIYPELYPELMENNLFVVSLLKVKVKTLDESVSADYYTYMSKHQKKNWLTTPFKKLFKGIGSLFVAPKDGKPSGIKSLNPYKLSKYDYDLVEKVKGKITCSVDKKTDVISISVEDQDPQVCATMADSVREHLQNFIIDYRTHKARIDVDHYQALTDSANNEYNKAVAKYSAYCDANQDVMLQIAISERDKLENDMQQKYNTYTAMNTQLEMMKVKLQERTPAFTTLKIASVPTKPAGPKRMMFVLGMLVFSTIITAFWLVRKELITTRTN